VYWVRSAPMMMTMRSWWSKARMMMVMVTTMMNPETMMLMMVLVLMRVLELPSALKLQMQRHRPATAVASEQDRVSRPQPMVVLCSQTNLPPSGRMSCLLLVHLLARVDPMQTATARSRLI